jgi:acyl-CoA synthetase (AMP-forming)/AMP-acid ligase II
MLQPDKMFVVQAFGVPDPKMGEEVCACVRCREGALLSEERLRAFCMGKVQCQRFQRLWKTVALMATASQYKSRRSCVLQACRSTQHVHGVTMLLHNKVGNANTV